MDCSRCAWKHPDVCRACKAEEKEARIDYDLDFAQRLFGELGKEMRKPYAACSSCKATVHADELSEQGLCEVCQLSFEAAKEV